MGKLKNKLKNKLIRLKNPVLLFHIACSALSFIGIILIVYFAQRGDLKDHWGIWLGVALGISNRSSYYWGVTDERLAQRERAKR